MLERDAAPDEHLRFDMELDSHLGAAHLPSFICAILSDAHSCLSRIQPLSPQPLDPN